MLKEMPLSNWDEGEFNVTGSRYGVFAECDIEQGEKPLVTVTSATGIGVTVLLPRYESYCT